MSITYNGTEIENITYNGNSIDTVNYNNMEVYVSTRTLTVNIGSYISSIIINGTTYSSNKTLSIKPGTTVTLNCNLNSNSTSNGLTTTYSFYRWTGYTTNTSKSFTFTMPNSNITYTANGTYSTSFSWPSSGNIPEATFLAGINNGSYNTSLVGRTVTLTEDSSTHDWKIIRVNSNSYDLWYYNGINYYGSIGSARWAGGDTSRYWLNNSSTDTGNPRGKCTAYKSKLSSNIQSKLKTGLNANCGSDTVVILSARQLGYTGEYVENDSNTAIPYFNSDDRRRGYDKYWTSTSAYAGVMHVWCIDSNQYDKTVFKDMYYSNTYKVIPAIRVG